MSPRLPVVSGQQLIRVLERSGWEVARQRGDVGVFMSLERLGSKRITGHLVQFVALWLSTTICQIVGELAHGRVFSVRGTPEALWKPPAVCAGARTRAAACAPLAPARRMLHTWARGSAPCGVAEPHDTGAAAASRTSSEPAQLRQLTVLFAITVVLGKEEPSLDHDASAHCTVVLFEEFPMIRGVRKAAEPMFHSATNAAPAEHPPLPISL